MSEGTRRDSGAHSSRDLVPENESGENLSAGSLQPFGARQRGRQRLDGALTGDVAVALAQLDGASRESIEKRRRARI